MGDLFHKDLNVILVENSIDGGKLPSNAAQPGSIVTSYDATNTSLTGLTNDQAKVVTSQGHTIDHLQCFPMGLRADWT